MLALAGNVVGVLGEDFVLESRHKAAPTGECDLL
jgi:hypothetical protein